MYDNDAEIKFSADTNIAFANVLVGTVGAGGLDVRRRDVNLWKW